MRRLVIAFAATLLFVTGTVVVPAFADPIIPDDTLDPVDEVVDPVEDAVDDILDPVEDAVDDTVGDSDDGAGDAVDDTVDDPTGGTGDGTSDPGSGSGSGGGTGSGSGGTGGGSDGGSGKGGKGGSGNKGGKDGGYGDLSWWTGKTPTYGMSAFDTRLIYQPFTDATRMVSTDTAYVTDDQIAQVGGSGVEGTDLLGADGSATTPLSIWVLPLGALVLASIAFALFEPEPGATKPRRRLGRRRRTTATAGS